MIKTLLKGDIISLKEETHNGNFTVLGVLRTKENGENEVYLLDEKGNTHTMLPSSNFSIIRHINQDDDFLDKNGVALRETDSFIDEDNGEKENKWTLGVCLPASTQDEEMYYNKSEFKRDCEILVNERNDGLFEVQGLVKNIKNLLDKYFKITGKKYVE